MWKKKPPKKEFGPLKNGNIISVAILMVMISINQSMPWLQFDDQNLVAKMKKQIWKKIRPFKNGDLILVAISTTKIFYQPIHTPKFDNLNLVTNVKNKNKFELLKNGDLISLGISTLGIFGNN